MPRELTADNLEIEVNASGDPVYIGSAAPTATTAMAAWRIAKLTYDASGNLIRRQHAKNTTTGVAGEYEHIYDNRTSLTYA